MSKGRCVPNTNCTPGITICSHTLAFLMPLLVTIWILYLLYIGYQVHDWMDMRRVSANLDITNRFFLKRIGVVATILLLSILLRLLNQTLLAKIVAALPIGVALIALTWMALAWLFVWLAFYIGNK
jgi:hypothetical protein